MAEHTKKKLYCVAVEVHMAGAVVKTSLEYIHADDPPVNIKAEDASKWRNANVLFKFRLTCPDSRRYHVVSVGEVIGYHVEDKKGEVLSV